MCSGILNANIASVKIEIAFWEDLQALARTVLKSMRRSLNDLEVQVRRQHNERCNIRILPDELLVRIFIFAASPSPVNLQTQTPDVEASRMRRAIVSTCSYWRRIALDTAVLWSYIYAHSRTPLSNQRSRLLEYLRRSKAAPLSLCLTLEDKNNYESFGELAEILAPHLDRCVAMTLGMTNSSFAEMKELRDAMALPALEYLNLRRGYGTSFFDDAFVLPRASSPLPLSTGLRHLILDSYVNSSYKSSYDLCYMASSCLTHAKLEFGHYDVTEIAKLLQSCPMLMELELKLTVTMRDAVRAASLPEQIELPRLEKLLLWSPSALEIGVVIHAPNLLHLAFTSVGYSNSIGPANISETSLLKQFITRFPNLQSCSCTLANAHVAIVLPALLEHQTIEKVEARNYEGVLPYLNDRLGSIGDHGDTAPMGPQLRTFTIACQDADFGTIRDDVARLAATFALRSSITLRARLHPDDLMDKSKIEDLLSDRFQVLSTMEDKLITKLSQRGW